MSLRKRIYLGLVGGCGILLLLLLAFVVLLPKLIDSQPVKKKILAEVSQRLSTQLQFEHIDLSYFPRLQVAVYQASLSLPEEVHGTISFLKIYPKILPLFTGKLHVSRIHVEEPGFKVRLPEGPEEDQTSLTSLLAPLFLEAQDLLVIIEKGTLVLYEGGKPLFSFQNLSSRVVFPPDGISIDLTCGSNLWDTVSLKGTFDKHGLKGSGTVNLARFRPQALVDYLFPNTAVRVEDSEINLGLDFETGGLSYLKAEVRASMPQLVLSRGEKSLNIKCQSLNAALDVDQNKTTVAIRGMDLENPPLEMTAEFSVDRVSGLLSLALEGIDVDVGPTREAALTLAGDISEVYDLFEVLKGGNVPAISIQIQGNSFADLIELENMRVKGQLREGEISIPEVNLKVEEVDGDATISEGFLDGKNIEARLGKARGREGTLKLGLEGEILPMHLDIMVDADVEQIVSDLKHLVEDEDVVKELSLIDHVEGRAQGRLVLGEDTSSISPIVEVSEFSLSANYQRIPFRLEVSGGRFFYDGTVVDVRNLSGKSEKSSFSNLSARLDLKRSPYLEIRSGESKASLEELYSWLTSYRAFRNKLEGLRKVRGSVHLSSTTLKGPVAEPDKWEFRTEGHARNIMIDTTLVPDQIWVSKGRFLAAAGSLSFMNAWTKMQDASMNISGTLEGYLRGLQKAELGFDGKMGPKVSQWFSKVLYMPPELSFRAPLFFKKAHLWWAKGDRAAFKGLLSVQKANEITLDVVHTPQALDIRQLGVQDDESQASLSFQLKGRELSLDFVGNLTRSTVDKILVSETFPSGSIKGDFHVHLDLDAPIRSKAKGRVEVGNLVLPWGRGFPSLIESVRLQALEDRLNVDSTVVKWGDHRLAMKGDLTTSKKNLVFDLDIKTDEFDWVMVRKALDEARPEDDAGKSVSPWSWPLEGNLRFKSGNFKFEDFTWNPFHANISFKQDGVNVEATEAGLCGIATPGNLAISPQDLVLEISPTAKNQDLDRSLTCLLRKEGLMTGNYDLSGNLSARGNREALTRSLQGDLEFFAEEGRIHRYGVLAKVLAFVNLTEVFKGKVPDITEEGFAYNTMEAKGIIRSGKLTLKEALIDGASMGVACEGDIDINKGTLDLKFLVAPLKTVDSIVKRIPLVNYLLNDTLVSVPVRVTGDWAEPVVTPLSPSAVGSGLFGVMKRAVKLPVKIIEPIIQSEDEKKGD
jgi:uncharacterized protein involved in outer membrane biogenesis